MSWDQPQPLAAFSREGPFNNMPVPKDVTVSRQVLAEPEAGLVDRTWVLITEAPEGGWGIDGHANTGQDIVAAARAALAASGDGN